MWKVQVSSRVMVGAVAGCLSVKGYRVINVDGKQYFAHRLAWLYVHGRWPVDQLDHINGVTDENRIKNLREATQSENLQNRSVQRNNKSGHPGVCWNSMRGKWQAHITIEGRHYFLGRFGRLEDAIATRVKAKSELHQFQKETRI